MTAPGSTITLRTSDGRHAVTALHGFTAPTVTGGRGGMSEVARPRRPAVTEWVGTSALQGTFTILLDEWDRGRTVATQLAALEAMAPIDPTAEPPTVTVSAAWPIPPNRPYVIQSLAYGEPLKTSTGQIARVEVTIDVIEYRAPNTSVRSSPAKASKARNSTGGRAKATTVIVKRGDTLSSLAAHYLGSASKWTTLAKLNGIRSPNNLKVGQKIKLR